MLFLNTSPFIAIHQIQLALVLRYIFILAIAREGESSSELGLV